MEKTIVKTAIYTLVGSFLVLLSVIPREKMITDFDGLSSYEIIDYPDFFFMIALYSARITVAAIVISLAVQYMLKYEDKNKDKF